MNGYNLLELTIRNILHVINPSKEDWSIRFHTIKEVQAIVASVESLRGATVEPFGSFASNLFTKWGDLDISIELQNGSYISSPGRKHKQSLLGDVLRALRKKGGFNRLQFICNARVPILKFEGSYNISCDISINNLSGQMKSKILFWINEIDGRFRDLVLLVKEWAKTHHINDSKSGSLNSYSLSLLVVFHLQDVTSAFSNDDFVSCPQFSLLSRHTRLHTLEPAILPPLKEIYPGNMTDDLRGVRAVAEKHIEDVCGVNINRIKSNKLRLINRSSLSELFISFLAKFSDICSRASTQGISPYAGQLEDIDTNMRWLPKTYALFVEDPFEQPANTARTVSSNQLIKISEAIQVTHRVLISANQNQSSLASVLVGSHMSQLVMRSSVSAPVITQSSSRGPGNNHSRNGLKTRPERKQMPFQTEQKPQSKRMDKHQNGTTNGPFHGSTSQKQQVWRPRSETKVDQIGSEG